MQWYALKVRQMKKSVILVLLILLAVTCFARTPTEEECQKEVQTALKNIEDGRKTLAASDYISAGTCYDNLKEYNKSLENFMAAAEVNLEISDNAGTCGAYKAVAGTYRTMKNEENAVKYYKLAIEYGLKAGLTGLIIADLYNELGDYENSCKYCKLKNDESTCKKYRYCKESSLSSSSSSEGGFPMVYLILGATIILILFAGLFLSKKKKK
jgi:tetratricopeptide (TPR) repeat protein